MKRTLRLLTAIMLSVFVAGPVCAGQTPDTPSGGSAVGKQVPPGTKEPDAQKSPPQKSGSKKPNSDTFPPPMGTEGPDGRKQTPKGTKEPAGRKSPSPKAGSKKPISDTYPAPTGTEGPEMRKAEQKKAQ